jgi:hypothetical protein
MPFPYHTHAVPIPCPCRAAKDCVFPIWFTQYGHVWFTHAMPCPCHATAMSFWKRFLKATAQRGIGMAWHMWISISHPETACGRPARVRLFQATTRSYTKVVIRSLNCRTSSSDISGCRAVFHEGHGTVGEWQGRGMTCVNLSGTAWTRHDMCELTLNGLIKFNEMGTYCYVFFFFGSWLQIHARCEISNICSIKGPTRCTYYVFFIPLYI